VPQAIGRDDGIRDAAAAAQRSRETRARTKEET